MVIIAPDIAKTRHYTKLYPDAGKIEAITDLIKNYNDKNTNRIFSWQIPFNNGLEDHV